MEIRMIPFVKHVAGFAAGVVIAAAVSPTAFADTTYRVGSTPSGVPFTFLDVQSGTIQGVMVDAITQAGKEEGFKVNIQQTVFSALIPSLTTQKIDIISAAMLDTPTRRQVVDFSGPVYKYGEAMVVKADDAGHYTSMDDMKGQVVGAQVGTAYIDALNHKGIFKEVRTYDTIADMIHDVALGRIKAGFADSPIVVWQVDHGAGSQVRVVKDYKPEVIGQIAFVVRKGDTGTLRQLDDAITKMKADGSLQQILQKWHLL